MCINFQTARIDWWSNAICGTSIIVRRRTGTICCGFSAINWCFRCYSKIWKWFVVKHGKPGFMRLIQVKQEVHFFSVNFSFREWWYTNSLPLRYILTGVCFIAFLKFIFYPYNQWNTVTFIQIKICWKP